MRRRFLLAILACLPLAACGGSATQAVHAGPAACPGYQTAYGCQAHSPTFGLPPTGPPKLTAPSSVPTVAMYDSVTVSVIPHGAPAVAGYTSGLFPTYRPLLSAFPAAYHVAITPQAIPVYPSLVPRMVCLDVEPKDATPAEAPAWVRGEIRLGLKPCIYSSLKNGMAETARLVANMLGAGWRSKVFLWDADWTGTPHLDAGFDATQWTNHFAGLNLDASTVTRGFLGIKPPPPPLPLCIHHRMSRSACTAAKAKIARARRAESSSNGAYLARDCQLFSQRISWFSGRLKAHPKTRTASRRRALSASRTAYRQRSCAVYKQRAGYFLAVIGRIEAAS